MAISLKNQLKQSRLLKESIRYTPPDIDVTKAGRVDVDTRAAATRLFYDFYAMEFMHRFLGSPKEPNINPQFAGHEDPLRATKMQRGMSATMRQPELHGGAMFANWGDVVEPLSGVVLPEKMRKVIDEVYEQVTISISRKLLQHLRLTLIQELRHMVRAASGWVTFRNQLVSIYNKNNTITEEDFENVIKENMPDMINHKDTVKRLLVFSKHYAKLEMGDGKDPSDAVVKASDSKTPSSEPSDPVSDPEPDNTDYSKPTPMPGEEPDIDSKEEIPDYPEYEYPKGEFDPENPFDKKHLKEDYASGRISPTTIKKVYGAFHAAKLTWEDIVLAYNNIPWCNKFGGPRWGSGVVAFLKLVPEAKVQNIEEMAGLVDHIFDLEHNTGALLNKGGMFISSYDLDRRAKVTHIARYLPNVSPMIARIIKQFMKYLSPTPDDEINMKALIDAPSKNFTPDQIKQLTDRKFKFENDIGIANAPFKNKKDNEIERFYKIKQNADGKFVLYDTINSDARTFSNFEDALKYIDTIKVGFIANTLEYPDKTSAVQNISKKLVRAYAKSSNNTSNLWTSELPKNAESKAVYNAHSGITKNPMSIRLTIEDESTLKKIGFEPKVLGQSVWYIHKLTGDSAKFYPNNTANVLFTNGKSGANATIKNTIETIISWLQANYTETTTQSPLVTGGVPLAKPSNAQKPSIKLSNIFEQKILAAGFVWNAAEFNYNDGGIILTIAPDRTSVLTGEDGTQYEFTTLPLLLTFLAQTYPQVKNSLKKKYNGNEEPNLVVDTQEFIDELSKQLIEHGIMNGDGTLDLHGGSHDINALFGGKSKKVEAIKLFRNYACKKITGKDPSKDYNIISLADAKLIIENFQKFIEYIKENGLPSYSDWKMGVVSNKMNQWANTKENSEGDNAKLNEDLHEWLLHHGFNYHDNHNTYIKMSRKSSEAMSQIIAYDKKNNILHYTSKANANTEAVTMDFSTKNKTEWQEFLNLLNNNNDENLQAARLTEAWHKFILSYGFAWDSNEKFYIKQTNDLQMIQYFPLIKSLTYAFTVNNSKHKFEYNMADPPETNNFAIKFLSLNKGDYNGNLRENNYKEQIKMIL